MKYVLAVLACIGEFFLLALIGVVLGWRNGGGALPTITLLALMAWTWRKITKKNISKPSPAVLPVTQWYFDYNGQDVGPISETDMEKFIDDGKITLETLVWEESLSEWIKAGDSVLKEHLATVKPSLTNIKVNNIIAWILAFAPLGVFLEYVIIHFFCKSDTSFKVTHMFLGYSTMIPSICLAYFDESRLRKVGYGINAYIIWLVPVYLFLRARTLKQSNICSVIWLICFVVWILFARGILPAFICLVAFLILSLLLTTWSEDQKNKKNV